MTEEDYLKLLREAVPPILNSPNVVVFSSPKGKDDPLPRFQISGSGDKKQITAEPPDLEKRGGGSSSPTGDTNYPFQVLNASQDGVPYVGVYQWSNLGGVATEGGAAFEFTDEPLWDSASLANPRPGAIACPDVGGYIAIQLEMNSAAQVVKASIVSIPTWEANTSAEYAGVVPDYYKFIRWPLAQIVASTDPEPGIAVVIDEDETRKIIQIWKGGDINMAYGILNGALWLYPVGAGVFVNPAA